MSSPASPMAPLAERGLRRDRLVPRRPRWAAGPRGGRARCGGVPARRDHDHRTGHVGPRVSSTLAGVGRGRGRLCRRPDQLLARSSHGPANLQLDGLSQAREGALGPGTRPHRPARGTGSARQSPDSRGARDRPSRGGRRRPFAGSLHCGLGRRVGGVGDRVGGSRGRRGKPAGLVAGPGHLWRGSAACCASMAAEEASAGSGSTEAAERARSCR